MTASTQANQRSASASVRGPAARGARDPRRCRQGREDRGGEARDALALARVDRDDGNPRGRRDVRRIEREPAVARDVGHRDSGDDGAAGVDDLREEVEGSRQGRGVEDDERDGRRVRSRQGVGDRALIEGTGVEAVGPGKVGYAEGGAVGRPRADGDLEGGSGRIDRALSRAGQRVEERGLPDVGIADQEDRGVPQGARGARRLTRGTRHD